MNTYQDVWRMSAMRGMRAEIYEECIGVLVPHFSLEDAPLMALVFVWEWVEMTDHDPSFMVPALVETWLMQHGDAGRSGYQDADCVQIPLEMWPPGWTEDIERQLDDSHYSEAPPPPWMYAEADRDAWKDGGHRI